MIDINQTNRSIITALAFVLASGGSAQADLVLSLDMSEASAPLVDSSATGATATQVGSHIVYQQTGVAAGTYGAITRLPATSLAAQQTNVDSRWALDSTGNAKMNSLTNNITVMAWVNLDGFIGPNHANIIGPIGGGIGFRFGINNASAGDGQRGMIFTTLGKFDWGYSGMTFGTGWHHFAVTKSSTTGLNFYCDGVLNYTFSGANENINTGAASYLIGDYQNSQSLAGGLIQEVKVYDTVLTTDEIITAAAGAVPEPASGLLALTGAAGLVLIRRRSRA